LTNRIKEIEVDHTERLNVINRLSDQLRESEADRAQRLDLVKRLSCQLEESESDRAACLEVINSLSDQLETVGKEKIESLEIAVKMEMNNRQLTSDIETARKELSDIKAGKIYTWLSYIGIKQGKK
jgi:uncharacterized coiled-coil protein SlyX